MHTILRDQRTIAGVGRGYSDDILFRARLSPYASLAKLGAEERERLIEAMHEVIVDASRWSASERAGCRRSWGTTSSFTTDPASPARCAASDLRRVSYESHEVTYCPSCQTGGKMLADRRMSRLLR